MKIVNHEPAEGKITEDCSKNPKSIFPFGVFWIYQSIV